MKSSKVLLVVDVQNDFCPGGSLGVKDGDKIIPLINKYMRMFSKKGFAVLATRDWHLRKTTHFKKFGGVWPVHCVQRTKGAMFNKKLKLPHEAMIISKGMDPKKDSYSAFQALDPKGIPLKKILKRLVVKEIYIAGIATDYCVRWTALDAIKSGFKVYVLTDAIKGVDPKDSKDALKEIKRRGAKLVKFDQVSV